MIKTATSTLLAALLGLALAFTAFAEAEADDVSEEVIVIPEMSFPADGHWHHYFDTTEAEAGEVNPGLGRAAAFLDTMQRAGVAADRLKVAVVIHGPPVYDVSNAARYAREYGAVSNPNERIIADLVAAGAEIWVCGVSARYRGVGNSDLLPGVRMAYSAMTANAELQRRGYTLNPY